MSGDPGGSRLDICTRSPLAAIVDALAAALEERAREAGRTAAEQVVRAALDRGAAPAGPAWLTQPRAAAVAGVSPQTIRAWFAAGHLTRGRRGRVNAEELRRYLEEGSPAPVAHVEDLSARRAKKTAAEILAKGAK